MLEIVSRKEAAELGLKFYFTGMPCKRGHISKRLTSNCCCMDCNAIRLLENKDAISARAKERYLERREEKLAYQRAYFEQNRETVLESKRRHYQQNKGSILADYRERYRIDPSIFKARNKSRYWLNREADLLRSKRYHAENPEKISGYKRRWEKRNPEARAAASERRRARKLNAEGYYTASYVKRLMILQRRKCAYCHISLARGYHVDHIISLAMGGSNWPSNLQLLCPTCNCKKGAKHPIQYRQEQGALL